MEKYIALLRGVNVGGNNIIPMPSLKAAFEEAGFAEVSTYINSGNIIFSSENENLLALQQKCHHAILHAFQLDIAVAVISAKDLREALEHAPKWWDKDDEAKHNAIFVIAPADAEAVMESVGEAKPEYEQVAHYGQVIFWSAPIKTFSRTRWAKIVSTSAYQTITIRNANTAKKLSRFCV
ncbi:MAG: DUF1697 domain-containing protein [Eubacteriales bacterium]|nr:DUF1697 domain-containing protein [Eubacteriales bacterium]